eukprot:3205110-Amphidinium_carterae.1
MGGMERIEDHAERCGANMAYAVVLKSLLASGMAEAKWWIQTLVIVLRRLAILAEANGGGTTEDRSVSMSPYLLRLPCSCDWSMLQDDFWLQDSVLGWVGFHNISSLLATMISSHSTQTGPQ